MKSGCIHLNIEYRKPGGKKLSGTKRQEVELFRLTIKNQENIVNLNTMYLFTYYWISLHTTMD